MRLETCLERISNLSTWDIRFHILAEGDGGRKWLVSFCNNASKMLEAWRSGNKPQMCIPENGDYIHGLLFINEVNGYAMAVNEEDLEGLDFEGLMWYLGKKTCL